MKISFVTMLMVLNAVLFTTTRVEANEARQHFARQADTLLQQAQAAKKGLEINLKQTERWPARRKARLLDDSTGQLISQARRLRNAIAKGEELPTLRRMVDDMVSIQQVVRFAWKDVKLAAAVNKAYERLFREVNEFQRVASL